MMMMMHRHETRGRCIVGGESGRSAHSGRRESHNGVAVVGHRLALRRVRVRVLLTQRAGFSANREQNAGFRDGQVCGL